MSEYIQDVDGYWYWEPVKAGYWTARVLRDKADKLDELNRNWDEIVQRAAAARRLKRESNND